MGLRNEGFPPVGIGRRRRCMTSSSTQAETSWPSCGRGLKERPKPASSIRWCNCTWESCRIRSWSSGIAIAFASSRRSSALLLQRQPLTDREKIRPGIFFEDVEPLPQIVDLEMIGADAFGELVPRQRRRYRGERQAAGRVGRDGGRTAAVPEIIDEDAAAPGRLGHGGDVTL